MTPGILPAVVLFAAPGTLEALERGLRRARVPTVRIRSVEALAGSSSPWLNRPASSEEYDTVIATSRSAVAFGVAPWLEARPRGRVGLEFWAVGPVTAGALRRLGVRRVRRPSGEGASSLARALRSGRPRKILYPRSDRAGPALARTLRRRGHRVFDPIVYRLRDPPRLRVRERGALRRARLLIVSSPSGLLSLRRRLDARTFAALRRGTRLLVLGERSARAARALGFRRTIRAETTTAQRLTRQVLRELRDA